MNKPYNLPLQSRLFTLFLTFLGILSITSCSTVQTIERGMGQNSPAFTSASAKRNKLVEMRNVLDQKSVLVFKSEEAQKDEKQPVESERIHSNGRTTEPSASNIRPSSIESPTRISNTNTEIMEKSAFWGNTTNTGNTTNAENTIYTGSPRNTRSPKNTGDHINTANAKNTGNTFKRVIKFDLLNHSKFFPNKHCLSPKNEFSMVKQFPPVGRTNTVFEPQYGFAEYDTQETLRAIGWLFIVGGPILLILGYSYIESIEMFILGCLFFVLIGLFYFWAANLSENLDDHCTAYRIGFWLTVIGWPLGFTLLIGIPLWIFGAIYDY